MKRTTLIAIAAILSACGAAITSGDNAADASQGSRRGKQARPAEDPMIREARELEEAVQSGGMPGCFDPSLRGRQRAVAERLGGVPCAASPGAAASAPARGGQSFAGYWSGGFEGGEVSAQITARGGNRFHVEVTTNNPATSCGGSISGVGAATGDRLSFSDTMSLGEAGDASCTMHLTRQGNRLSLSSEGDCHYWSGMSCGFGGTLRLQGATRH